MKSFIYPVKDWEVIDGDTVKVYLDLGWNMVKKTNLRLDGINAPESRTRNKLEKQAGLLVKQEVEKWMCNNLDNDLHVTSTKKPKYAGRTVGDIYVENYSLASFLVRNNLVKIYTGGKRTWTTKELKSIIEILS